MYTDYASIKQDTLAYKGHSFNKSTPNIKDTPSVRPEVATNETTGTVPENEPISNMLLNLLKDALHDGPGNACTDTLRRPVAVLCHQGTPSSGCDHWGEAQQASVTTVAVSVWPS